MPQHHQPAFLQANIGSTTAGHPNLNRSTAVEQQKCTAQQQSEQQPLPCPPQPRHCRPYYCSLCFCYTMQCTPCDFHLCSLCSMAPRGTLSSVSNVPALNDPTAPLVTAHLRQSPPATAPPVTAVQPSTAAIHSLESSADPLRPCSLSGRLAVAGRCTSTAAIAHAGLSACARRCRAGFGSAAKHSEGLLSCRQQLMHLQQVQRSMECLSLLAICWVRQ